MLAVDLLCQDAAGGLLDLSGGGRAAGAGPGRLTLHHRGGQQRGSGPPSAAGAGGEDPHCNPGRQPAGRADHHLHLHPAPHGDHGHLALAAPVEF